MFFYPDTSSLVGFVTILVFCVAVILRTIQVTFNKDHSNRISIGLFVYFLIFTGIVKMKWVQGSPYPRLMILFVIVNLISVAIALSPLGKAIAAKSRFRSLILFQAFRLPLELVLHSWSDQGVIPSTMTWTGLNFDILTGFLALIFAWKADQKKWLAWTYNLVGLGLLLNVMRVAMFSSPLPFAWPVIPPLQLIYETPYAYILPVCVSSALAVHIISIRKLMLGRSPKSL